MAEGGEGREGGGISLKGGRKEGEIYVSTSRDDEKTEIDRREMFT